MDNITRINKSLKSLFGVSIDGKVNFRVIWSDSLTEKRKGDFVKVTPNGIYLGEQKNVIMEVPKYSYLRERFILEGYNLAHKANPEIVVSDGYEPLYVFQKKDGTYLKPELWACEYFINTMRGTKVIKRTEAMDAVVDDEIVEKRAQEYFEQLSGDN